MLPTASTALSAAQLAHVFENGAHFLMTSMRNSGGAHPSISLRLSLERERQREPWLDSLTGKKTKRTLAKGPDREKESMLQADSLQLHHHSGRGHCLNEFLQQPTSSRLQRKVHEHVHFDLKTNALSDTQATCNSQPLRLPVVMSGLHNVIAEQRPPRDHRGAMCEAYCGLRLEQHWQQFIALGNDFVQTSLDNNITWP